MVRFAIFGAGAWGTALAIHLARAGQVVTLVPRREEQAALMRSQRQNEARLPGFSLPDNLHVDADSDQALANSDVVFLGCPSVGLKDFCHSLSVSPALRVGGHGHVLISLAKGLEQKTLDVPSRVVQAALPYSDFGILSGPSFASEIAAGKPAALVLAMHGPSELIEDIQCALSNAAMRIYLSDDILGVELGGCLKNIYAISAGICASLDLGSNATSALLTRALNEMVTLSVAMGADLRTLYGLAGFGDLMATCSDDQSRNRTFGKRIGRGESAEAILASQGSVVEGYRACDCFYQLCQKRGLVAPILNQIYAVLFECKPARQALTDLMTRSLKAEH